MESLEHIEILDCPLCGGAGYLSDEGGWAVTVQCVDCGAATAPASYNTPEERMDAAKLAAYTWNMGKVIYTGPGD